MIARKRRKKPSKRAEFIKALIVVVLIGLVLRIFVALPYWVKTGEMEGSLQAGDFLLVNQLAYRSEPPKIGEIVVFEHPLKVGMEKIGRVIATEGQTVEVKAKVVYVDNKPIDNPSYVRHTDYRIIPEDYSNRDFAPVVQVPTNSIYVLCDNRDTAEDSRQFGPVNNLSVKGRGLFVYWSWKPDQNAPKWESPYVIPAVEIFFYNLFHFPSRIDLSRVGAASK
jgi:signal peptidase I